MIVNLPHTSTKDIDKALRDALEHGSQTIGRVLTLIVVASQDDDIEHLIEVTANASHEHPARVLVLLRDHDCDKSHLNAEVRTGSATGASEMVIMHVSGDMAKHIDSVVSPLLLPDTPIVAWWPTNAPEVPAEHPIGALAQRRITNLMHADGSAPSLEKLHETYRPGDTDMLWTRITLWRGVVASVLDQSPHEPVTKVDIAGPEGNLSVDIAAAWLADRLDVPVTRHDSSDFGPEVFPIHSLVLHRESGEMTIKTKDAHTIEITTPTVPASQLALSARSDSDCLSEELRHLDSDVIYAASLESANLIKR